MRLRADGLLMKLFAACVLAALACASARAQDGRPRVTKVEPPSWWANHSVNPVRLLLRGNNLKGVVAAVPNGSPFQVTGQKSNESGTYLFVDLRINPDARPGDYDLIVMRHAGDKISTVSLTFRINAPLDPATHFQGITTDDVIYLIMPDRFADGDARLNSPADSPPAANDRKNPRACHGGDFRD